ncbi:dihydrodipicolinate synthase [Burkholderia lata]|uniref:Dihydrodipicolinate synthase n=1 Tax=Burkholderia lata (strain ATCC 17760 / DSM 23089 / LMG 22485 / NCIMB 9086 / R18194 / 383) TaxID=482957 RepID=A0A6P2V8S7_BURL3|nr:dihydrodipicolinate synthase family protein [Burkholderia lata]VWC76691.1 dihydrodipicolinate synthase [Burkholderia lata]
MKILKGLSAFPITPIDESGRVDTSALRGLVARLRDAKVDSIGLLGSTGSYVYLTREERRRALEAAIDEVGKQVPIVVGIGALRTDDAVKLAQDAKSIGASVGLLAAVSYAPLTESEVFDHFNTVARASKLPICIYDNPSTTHFQFTPELIGRLANNVEIVAAKSDAPSPSEVPKHLANLRGRVPIDFSLGYSSDWNTTEALIAGADTWYSVLGGILPEVCVRITRAVQEGNFEEARRLDAGLRPIWDLFTEFGSLRVVYAIAEILHLNRTVPPLPVQGLSTAAKQRVREAVGSLSKELIG